MLGLLVVILVVFLAIVVIDMKRFYRK